MMNTTDFPLCGGSKFFEGNPITASEIATMKMNNTGTNYHVKFEPIGDTVMPIGFKFTLKNPMTAILFALPEQTRLVITIDDVQIISIPFKLVKDCIKATVGNGIITYKFDLSPFMPAIPLIRQPNASIHLEVCDEHIISKINSIEVFCQYTYLDMEQRRNLAYSKDWNSKIMTIESVSADVKDSIINFTVPANGICKGIIMESEHVTSLNRLTVYFNDHVRWSYTPTDFPIVGQMLTPLHLYIPFNNSAPLYSRAVESFDGAVNIYEIYKVTLKLEVYYLPQQITMHSVIGKTLNIGDDCGHFKGHPICINVKKHAETRESRP